MSTYRLLALCCFLSGVLTIAPRVSLAQDDDQDFPVNPNVPAGQQAPPNDDPFRHQSQDVVPDDAPEFLPDARPMPRDAPMEMRVPLPPVKSVTSLVRSGEGDIWVGAEDEGVWRFSQRSWKWSNFRLTDGLGDEHVYCLAVDKGNRVWAGLDSKGVSVFDGASWRNYDAGQGPLGERVRAIAVCPIEGDVWIAHNCGLTRYSIKNDRWTHFTRASGLPTTELSALAFNAAGDLWVGTQDHGVLLARRGENYGKWQRFTGPNSLTRSPRGWGLPSNQINSLLVSSTGCVSVATSHGLAWTRDEGRSWRYVRGADWEQQWKGRFFPRRLTGTRLPFGHTTTREDYLTTLAQDASGFMWLGFRRKGFALWRPQKGRAAWASRRDKGTDYPYVTSLLAAGEGRVLLGTYGDGLRWSWIKPSFHLDAQETVEREQSLVASPAPTQEMGLPSPQNVLSLAEMKAMTEELRRVPELQVAPDAHLVEALDEDWTTKGDWLGRYGRHSAVLCAMFSPDNLTWNAGAKEGEEQWPYVLQISPFQKNNALRYWVHALATEEPRTLEMPPLYYQSRVWWGLSDWQQTRRQAEVDDNGEEYPLTKEGPHIYASVRIPKGWWVVGFYNFNKDGHSWLNRMRDYRYSMRAHDPLLPLGNISDFWQQPELAHARQRDFWGGVYKRFLVHGPQELTVEINKGTSLNTLLAGLFLDPLDAGEVDPSHAISPGARVAAFQGIKEEENSAAQQLWQEWQNVRERNPVWWALEHRRFGRAQRDWLARHGQKSDFDSLFRLSQSAFEAGLFEDGEAALRQAGQIPLRDLEKHLVWDGDNPTVGNHAGQLQQLKEVAAKDKPLYPATKAQLRANYSRWFDRESQR